MDEEVLKDHLEVAMSADKRVRQTIEWIVQHGQGKRTRHDSFKRCTLRRP